MQILLAVSLLLLQAGLLPAKNLKKEKSFAPCYAKPYPEKSCAFCNLGNSKLVEGAYKVPDHKSHRKTSPLVSSPPTIICFPDRETSRKNFEEQNRRLFFLGY